MKLEKETLGKLSIGFAVCGLTLPILIAIFNVVMDPSSTAKSYSEGILFLFLQFTAIVLAISARKTREAKIGAIVAIASLSLLFTMAAFATYHKMEEPRKQTLAYYRGLHDQNWRALWKLTGFGPKQRETWTSPAIYEQAMQENYQLPEARETFEYFTHARDIKVGKAFVQGDRASVTTYATVDMNGKVMHMVGRAELREEDGVWKVVLSENDTDPPLRSLRALVGIRPTYKFP